MPFKNPLFHVFSTLLIIVLLFGQATPALAAPGDTIRVAVASDGTPANNVSYSPSISSDGRFVVFQSGASNLVSEDTNGYVDVFVHDIVMKTTALVSVASNGTQGNSGANNPYISANGRYVAFRSWSDNLVVGDTNAARDIFVRDIVTNTTTRVSVASDGTQGNRDSDIPSISADGRHIAFHSDARNLVAGDTNDLRDVFIRDTVTNTTTRVSIASNGAEGNGNSRDPSISADGRYVAFWSDANNLVDGDTNGHDDVFIHDMQTNTTGLISVASDGTQGNASTSTFLSVSISADGRYVAFGSDASNLVSNDTNGVRDIFLRDTIANTTTLISSGSNYTQSNAYSCNPSISADGRYVAFYSEANNLVIKDVNWVSDIFVRDTVLNTTTIASVSSSGIQGNYNSYEPSISADGHFVVFESFATNLVSGPANGGSDIFMHENGIPPTESLTIKSISAQDGWILESSEISKKGGSLDAIATTFRLGDDTTKKQYLGILSFNTGDSLPDDAMITAVILRVKRQGIIGGGNPVTTFQGFLVDIKKGTFGIAALQVGDFQSPLGTAGKTYGPFKPALVGGWYNIDLTSGSAYINKSSTASGLTQIRLRFKLDDNNNTVANYLSLYSGNAALASRPQLLIEYYVP